MKTEEKTVQIGIRMHQGKVLLRLANNYSTLIAVVLEVIQNAIDSLASRVEIIIDMRKRTFSVYDNGSGAGREKVAEAVRSIGNTLKDSTKYGQFGLGLISPLSVSERFEFTSCPSTRNGSYMSYEFVTKSIANQSDVIITGCPEESLEFDPNGRTWWRTRVEAKGITRDKRKSRISLQELVGEIALKYGEGIRKNSISIRVSLINSGGDKEDAHVEAPEYSGQGLDIIKSENTESGIVLIRLYLANLGKKGRQGNVVFGSTANPSRISSKQFVECTRSLLDTEVSKALMSGVFEGEILCEKVLLHPDRTRFEENDTLLSFCGVIESWYKEIGSKVVKEAEDQASSDRFQRIGTSVMPFAEQLLKQSTFEGILGRINLGTVGRGHARVPKKSVVGTLDENAISSEGGAFSDRGNIEEDEGGKSRKDQKEDPEHSPGIVLGPKGRRRTEVLGGSTGLRFQYVEFEDFRIPFDFDPNSGTLFFNIRYPSFGQCQQSDQFLADYHIFVVTTALFNETFRDQNGNLPPEVVKYSHEFIQLEAFAICNGRALSGLRS